MMKRIVAIVILILSTNLIFAQNKDAGVVEIEEEIQLESDEDSRVYIIVDPVLYPKTYPAPHDSGFWAQDGKAYLEARIRPQTYEKLKQHMNAQIGGLKIIESKEIELEGILFLYQKSEQNRAGEIIDLVYYTKVNDKNSVIVIGGFFSKGSESIYKSAIKQAAISAKIIKE